MKQIIAAHDLSGVGRASLGAVMPVVSAMEGVVLPLPTAVLSSITGVFEGYRIADLTGQMSETLDHWQELEVSPDCIYSGFLGGHEQVDIIISAIDRFKGIYVVVDPVFADEGRLYPTMSMEMVENMKRLVTYADVITPNVTEAMFLLGESNETPSEAEIKDWLVRLCGMGPKCSIITSVMLDGGMYVMAYNRETGDFWRYKVEYIPVKYHGTGDVFTSAVVGAIMRGDKFENAITLAAEFVQRAISATIDANYDYRYGVLIEKVLGELAPVENKCVRF